MHRSPPLGAALAVRLALFVALACALAPRGAAQNTRPRSDPYVPFPVALFAVHPPVGDAPLTVRFSDNSLGAITSWSWDFGDGTTSRARSPSKVYTEPGVYAVTLTVRGPGGQSRVARPEGVTARSCTMGSARSNRVAPLERGEDYIPITGDDALGIYCVYSGKAVGGGSPGLANNVGIFVLPLENGEVLLYGSGYGDRNSFVEPTRDAAHDVRRVDAIVRFCLGREPRRTPIRFVAPHGHIDHINSDFVRELRQRGYPIVDIAFHNADANTVRNLPGWTTSDRAAFRVLRSPTGVCQEELASYASPLGRIWLFLRSGHTPGSIDLVIDVRGDPQNRFVVRGSGEIYGTCPVPGVREAIDPHGNVVFTAPAPKLFALSPSNGSVLGTTSVVVSGDGFAAILAGRPQVLFDGVAAADVVVLDDQTLTCTVPPGVPGRRVDVQVGNRNGRATLAGQFTYRALPTLAGVSPNSAPTGGGTELTLRGTGFLVDGAGPNAVRIGGASASNVRVVDDATLTCTAPPGVLGTASVVLTNANGGAELTGLFRYVPNVDVRSVTPALGTALGGTSVAVEGANFALGAAVPEVFFNGVRASQVVRVSDSRLACVTPPGPGGTLVDVRVSAENGSDVLASGFRYFKMPEVASVAPASGSSVGGELLTVTGNQFTRNDAGPNLVRIGGLAALDVVTLSDTQLTCRAPAGLPGARVDVSVSNKNGSGTLALGYRYHQRPRLDALEPASGPRDGGTLVTLRGAHFQENGALTSAVLFDGRAASAVVVLDDGTLTCRTPSALRDGLVDVRLVNANGEAELGQAFRYASRPVLTGLAPSSGRASGGVQVTLTGSGFNAAGAGPLAVSFGGAPATEVNVLDDTRLTCRTPFLRAGTRVDVRVANQNGFALLPGAFEVLRPPSLSSVRPEEGPVAGGTRVVISGSGLTGTRRVAFGGVAASAVLVLDDGRVECTTPPATSGAVDVTLDALAGPATLREGFTYGPGRVVLTRLVPAHGPSAGGPRIELEGSGFYASSAGTTEVRFGGAPASGVVVLNDTRLSCVPPPGAPGAVVDVLVTNQNGNALGVRAYRYSLQPALSGLVPASGSPFGGTSVTLTGSGFTRDEARAHVVRFGGVAAEDVQVVDDATLTCRAPGGAARASVDVELVNSNGSARLAGAFRYRAPPSLTSVSPSTGSALGGFVLTLAGADLAEEGAGTTRVLFGSVEATSVSVLDGGRVTCLLPAGAAGASVDVQLVNDNGTAVLPQAFRYHPGPAITTLAPSSGFAAGGTLVVLTGSGFRTSVSGPNAVTFGGKPARNVVTVDDTRVRAVAPLGTPGARVDLVLSNSNGVAIVPEGFRYHARPEILALDPPAASGLGGTSVTLHGRGFLADGAGANTISFGGRPAVSVVVLDDATLRCVEPGGPSGSAVEVVLTNVNGAATPVLFDYFPAPRLDELVPAHGFSGGGTWVELHGTAFLANEAGANAVFFGAEEASEVTVLDDGTLRCRTPAGAPGSVDVLLLNANGSASLLGGFVYDWAPTVTSVEPAEGSALGGSSVLVRGGGFQTPGAGPLAVRFGANPASDVQVLDAFTLRCVTPSGPAGTSVALVVSNSRGTSSLDGFAYRPRPRLLGIEPRSGPPEGGTRVTLSGSGFLEREAGAAQVFFGAAPASDVVVLDDATLTCTSPAGLARSSAAVEVRNANGATSVADGWRWRPRIPGDLDDDGLGDALLVGGDGVYVFFGTELGLADESTAAADLVLRAANANTDFGAEVAAGDLNADGISDLVVSAPLDDGGASDSGAAYVFFGPLAASPTARLSSSANAVFRGAQSGDRLGTGLALGDVSGDGLLDLVLGAPFSDAPGNDGGVVYLHHGRAGFTSQTPAQANVRLVGPSSFDNFGAALATGDVTGDLVVDLLVGAPNAGSSSAGGVYVFRGGASLVSGPASSAMVLISGDGNDEHLGSSLAAGDFDGDGFADLFLGTPDGQQSGTTGGLVYYLRGGPTLSTRRADQNSIVLSAEGGGDRLGQELTLGDVNADGRADLLVGAPQHDLPQLNAGRAYLVLGGALASGSIGLRASSVLVAESSSGDLFGSGLALLDLDDDARAELVIGAPGSNGGGADSGRVYVFLGAAVLASRSAGADDATFGGASSALGLGREIGGTR
jgi:PKD repeat protein